jgi:malate dehydrogenase (oxaloacetate-decarboxylating)
MRPKSSTTKYGEFFKENVVNSKKLTKEELIAKAAKPSKDAMKLHPFYKGKVEVVPKCCIRDIDDFAIWYTPGVAAPCKAIQANPEEVLQHTAKSNMIAVVSDGTRVLGLGNIGPEAGLPVMEGKAILFKYLGGVDAVPLCIEAENAEDIIHFVKQIQPTFGGINLEDIEKPKCFKVLDTLRKEARIPVWHDDQQGTAAVTLAGLINAVKIVNKPLDKVKIGMLGVGASNQRIAIMLAKAGVDPTLTYMCDSKGLVYKGRADLEKDPYKKYLADITNGEQRTGGPEVAFEGADVMIALSRPGPDTVKPEWIKSMAKDSIVFVCANPVPEIWPWEAKEAGAHIVATGRSDFPNQVNNSLGFPGIFRGTLDVMATTITDEMCIEAARELAKVAEDKGLSDEYLIPTMDEWEVFPREAVAVGQKAIEQKVAQLKLTPEEAFEKAETTIRRARQEMTMRQDKGFVKMPPA